MLCSVLALSNAETQPTQPTPIIEVPEDAETGEFGSPELIFQQQDEPVLVADILQDRAQSPAEVLVAGIAAPQALELLEGFRGLSGANQGRGQRLAGPQIPGALGERGPAVVPVLGQRDVRPEEIAFGVGLDAQHFPAADVPVSVLAAARLDYRELQAARAKAAGDSLIAFGIPGSSGLSFRLGLRVEGGTKRHGAR